jgi:hypothetical protein
MGLMEKSFLGQTEARISSRFTSGFPVKVNRFSRAMAFYRNKMSWNKGGKPKILPY